MQCADPVPVFTQQVARCQCPVSGAGTGRYQDKPRTGLIALVSTGYSRYVDIYWTGRYVDTDHSVTIASVAPH